MQPSTTATRTGSTLIVNVVVTVGDPRLGHVHRLAPRAALDAAAARRARRGRAGAAGRAGTRHRAGPDRPRDARRARPPDLPDLHARRRAGLPRATSTPTSCATAPRVIQDQANEALTDLRGVLGVLRDAETGELADAPAADVRRPAGAGRRRPARPGCTSSSRDRLPRDAPVPDVVGRTVYRIVQEGITNAAQARPRRACCASRSAARPTTASTSLLRNPLGFGPHRARRAPGWA